MGEKYGGKETEKAEKANAEIPKTYAEENDRHICRNHLHADRSDRPSDVY